ncbi:MAG: hypothetical protein J2P21_13780, partial [Chloracidobacterium sp.]|nr:hypothetical protein [Chloracidobacterium sp.]
EPAPEPTPEPTLEPTLEPTQDPNTRRSSTAAPKTKVNIPKGAKTEQSKSDRGIRPQGIPVKLPETPNQSPPLAQSAASAAPIISKMPNTAAQNENNEIPPAPPKKCGMLHKMLAGCKNKQPKPPRGGAVGVAGSAAESKARSTINQGVGKAIPFP